MQNEQLTAPEDRARSLFEEHQSDIYRRTDHLFAGLMVCQWLFGLLLAFVVSPRSWAGQFSQTHIHVWAALGLGGLITAFPVGLAIWCPGRTITRHVIAIGQMLMGGLLIHLTGGLVDERADLFAVGVMLVETLTGTRPFGGATQQEILLALLQGECHLPGDLAETRLLDAIVQRCLAKDPRDRYGSVADVAKDLVPALGRSVGFGAHRASTISESPTLGDWNSPI